MTIKMQSLETDILMWEALIEQYEKDLEDINPKSMPMNVMLSNHLGHMKLNLQEAKDRFVKEALEQEVRDELRKDTKNE